MSSERILDISWPAVFRISLTILCFYLLFLIRDILILLVFALIVSVLFNPAVDFLQKRRLPRGLSVIFVYIAVFGVISLIIYAVVPLFVSEIQQFSQLLPQYFERIAPSLRGLGIKAFENIETFTAAVSQNLEGAAQNIFSALSLVFGGIFSTVFVITVAAFLSAEEKIMERALAVFIPKRYEAYSFALWKRCQAKVSGWFVSRILASVFVGMASYIAFLIFGVKYAFSLGLLAGALNFVPIVGPLVTGALIFLIVGLDSALRAVFVLVVFVLIQQVENNILTPLLSKKFMGIPAVLVMIALVVGGKLWGFLGAVLAIPLAGILFEFLRDFLKKRKEEKTVVL